MTKKFFWGFLLGGLAGAAYGLLTTPRTGKENQELVKRYIDDTTYHVQDVSEKLQNLQNAVGNLTQESKNFANVFSEDLQQTVSNFTYEAEPRIRRIQNQAQQLSNDVQQASEQISSSLSN